MIDVDGVSYYTAAEVAPMLGMKYTSVIHLLKKSRIRKYQNKYIISQEDYEKLKNRENQTIKSFMFSDLERLTHGK